MITRPADPRPQTFDIDRICGIREKMRHAKWPSETGGGNNAFGDAPIAAELVRPHIIRDRTARAWLRAYSGRAEFAAPLDSCSQFSAKFVILLPETRHSLHAAFFKNRSGPHGGILQR